MTQVTFLGGGSFGTALAVLLAKKGLDVKLWDRNEQSVELINKDRENKRYLPGVHIPEKVTALNNIDDAISGSNYIVLSVPSQVIRSICKRIKNKISKDAIIVNIAKGIEEESHKRLSQVIKEELPDNPVTILSGPSHAEEVAISIPTVVVAACENLEYAKHVQDLFMTDTFRVYTNEDMIGIEIGGAVKNIIALAAGVSDGLGYGDNTKAALMTRGMSEIIRIGTRLGGKLQTFSGLTGMGDLIVTCTSMHSRNRRAGILLGQGKSKEEAIKEVGMVVEGINACKAFYELKEKIAVEMPITDYLYKVLFCGLDVRNVTNGLMNRDKKHELV